ncbi:MAG: asparagine synthase-related protein [Thermoplasmata archaeon]|nr:asparagine synthase-related protein [Thermoplasmata archaeon]
MSDGPFGNLDTALAASLDDLTRTASSATVLYSGGVDSTVLAAALAPRVSVRLLSVGVRGSGDLGAGRRGADLLGLPWTGAEVGPPEVGAALRRHDLAPLPEPTRSVFAALALAFDAAPRGPPVVLGQGADELFGGYAHFRGLPPAAAEARRTDDWNRLTVQDWPRTLAIAARIDQRLAAPFLSAEFAAAAMAIPLSSVRSGELTKPGFRAWAAHRGIPEEIVGRPKRAFQYGSGIAAAVREVLGT